VKQTKQKHLALQKVINSPSQTVGRLKKSGIEAQVDFWAQALSSYAKDPDRYTMLILLDTYVVHNYPINW
jgi:hypothetical protein